MQSNPQNVMISGCDLMTTGSHGPLLDVMGIGWECLHVIFFGDDVRVEIFYILTVKAGHNFFLN